MREYSSGLERMRGYSSVLEHMREYSTVLEHMREYSSVLERMRECSGAVAHRGRNGKKDTPSDLSFQCPALFHNLTACTRPAPIGS